MKFFGFFKFTSESFSEKFLEAARSGEISFSIDAKDLTFDEIARIQREVKKGPVTTYPVSFTNIHYHEENIMITNFGSIADSQDLIKFISSGVRFNGHSEVCQYTNVSSLKNILTSKYLFMGKPEKMNDQEEYENFRGHWDGIFFASVMLTVEESVPMWNIYAKPFDKGCKWSISTNELKRTIKETKYVYRVDENYNLHTDERIPVGNGPDEAKLSLVRILYRRFDGSLKYHATKHDCNTNFPDIYSRPELAGYVKSAPWENELEVRVMVRLPERFKSYAGVGLVMPKHLLDTVTITKSPFFNDSTAEQDLRNFIRDNYDDAIPIKESVVNMTIK